MCTDADFDPSKVARDARKARVAKNERQQQQNIARAQQGAPSSSAVSSTQDRKRDVDRTLATTRASTASMGRFDRTLEGEKKLKGVKRKVCRAFHFTSNAVLTMCSLIQQRFRPRPRSHRIWLF